MDWKKFAKGETLDNKERNRVDKKEGKMKSHGFNNPTAVTRYSYDNQNMMASFDKFYNAFGMLTFNMEKQATFNFYNNQLKQSFMLAAQNDEMIKQNNVIIDQNEDIIKLLSQIANK